jgi:hypothetical protein
LLPERQQFSKFLINWKIMKTLEKILKTYRSWLSILLLSSVLFSCEKEKENTEVKYLVAVPSELNIVVGTAKKPAIYVVPNRVDQSVIWTSSDPDIAFVDEDGVVTGINLGTTVVTAASAVDTSCKVEILVTINSALVAHEILVSQGRPVTASDELDSFLASNAVDGSNGSRWVANDASFSEHWLEISLAEEYEITRIVIDGDDATLNSDFAVQALVAGGWTDIVSVRDSRVGDYEFLSFTPVKTTKIRYIGQDVNYYPSGVLYNGVRIWEIKIYATIWE